MTAVYVEPDYDASQRREIALMYSSLGRGEKGAYAKKVGVPTHRIRRWISALADGDLDGERFPRKLGTMTTKDTAEVQRLQRLLAAKDLEMKKALAAKDAELTSMKEANAILGKAITVLQNLSERQSKAGDISPLSNT